VPRAAFLEVCNVLLKALEMCGAYCTDLPAWPTLELVIGHSRPTTGS